MKNSNSYLNKIAPIVCVKYINSTKQCHYNTLSFPVGYKECILKD